MSARKPRSLLDIAREESVPLSHWLAFIGILTTLLLLLIGAMILVGRWAQ